MSESQEFVREEDRDLGFGSVVARDSQRRLLNRDGSFNVLRKGRGLRSALSLYYSLLSMSWPRFLLMGMVAYLVANALFALDMSFAAPMLYRGDLVRAGVAAGAGPSSSASTRCRR
jgi:inward rectifier potassium channel